MTRKILYLTLFIFFIRVHLFADAPIKFYKENTTISLTNTSVTVKGLYLFENTTDLEIDVDIIYPFFVDIFNPFPKKIEVFNPKEPLSFSKVKKGIEYSLHFTPVGIETVSVEYTQTLKKKNATYMLKKFWNDKTDRTSLIIETPLDFGTLNLSIEADSVKAEKKKRVYFITKRFFKPKENLKLTWK